MRIDRSGPLAVLLVLALAVGARVASAQFFTANAKFDRSPEAVTWTNGSVQLSGVVVVPNTPGRHPAVVIVVLLFDKRGGGESICAPVKPACRNSGLGRGSEILDFCPATSKVYYMTSTLCRFDQQQLRCPAS